MPTQSERLTLCVYERERERARGSTERDGNAGTMGVELCVNKFFVCGAFLAIFLAFFISC